MRIERTFTEEELQLFHPEYAAAIRAGKIVWSRGSEPEVTGDRVWSSVRIREVVLAREVRPEDVEKIGREPIGCEWDEERPPECQHLPREREEECVVRETGWGGRRVSIRVL